MAAAPPALSAARWRDRCGPRLLGSVARLEPSVLIRPPRSTEKTDGPTEDRRAVDRDGRIRTGDPLNPIQVRYRTAPRPV